MLIWRMYKNWKINFRCSNNLWWWSYYLIQTNTRDSSYVTTESELIAANEVAKKIFWISRLFKEIDNLKQVPVLQVDNSAAVKLAQNPEYHRRTTHINIKHFFIREKISEGKLRMQEISTTLQIADLLTKLLPKTRL